MLAFIFLVPSISDGQANLCFQIPSVAKSPAVAVAATKSQKVALSPMMFQRGVEIKWETDAADVIVAVNPVYAEEPFVVKAVCVVTDVRRNHHVAPLLVLCFVDVPCVYSSRYSQHPKRVNLEIDTEIGRQGDIVEQIVSYRNRLPFNAYKRSDGYE